MTPFMHWKKHLCWLAPLLLLDGLGLLFYLRWIETRPAAPAPESEALELELDQAPPGAVVPQLRKMVFPTGQTGLLDPAAANVFQPTASGRPESALYGSTRTGRRGKFLRATFHEGIDVAAVRRDHPKFRMVGAFDKTVMKKGEAAMRAEFERLMPVMRQGGLIPGVDHQTPPDVSLEMYRLYVRLLREYCEKAMAR